MTPPIDPVEETSIEKDAETVRKWLPEVAGTAREALTRILAELDELHHTAEQAIERRQEYLTELTLEKLRANKAEFELVEVASTWKSSYILEKQRGEAYRAALDTLLVEISKEEDEHGFPFNFALREAHREALRISQGDSK